MGARDQARHTGKVLAIEELEGSVPRMLCGAPGAREMRYQLFSIQDDHARFTQPARRTMEAQSKRLGYVRRWPWQAPLTYPGGHIAGFLQEARLQQPWAIPFYQHRLEDEAVLSRAVRAKKGRNAEDVRGIGK